MSAGYDRFIDDEIAARKAMLGTPPERLLCIGGPLNGQYKQFVGPCLRWLKPPKFAPISAIRTPDTEGAVFPVVAWLGDEDVYYAMTCTELLSARREKRYIEQDRYAEWQRISRDAEAARLLAYETSRVADQLEAALNSDGRVVGYIALDQMHRANKLFMEASQLLEPDRKDY